MESAGRTSEFRVEGLDLGKVPQMPFSRLLTSFTERERCVVTGLPPGFTTSGKSAQHDVMRTRSKAITPLRNCFISYCDLKVNIG